MKRIIESLSGNEFLNSVWRLALGLTILVTLCFEVQAQTWSSQTSGTANNLFSIHFVSANEGWAVGFSNTILHTTNSGANWSPVSSPGGVPVSSYLGVRFIDSSTGWVAGGSVTMRTTDSGASWNALVDVTAGDFINNLFATSATQAWAPVSRTGGRFFARYTAQGNGTLISEIFDNLSGASFFLDIYFTDPDNGWAVGSPGFIRRITNASTGTVTFAPQTSGTTQTLNGIFMLDANTGWTVGNAGTILKTTNGGTNWAPQTSGTATNLRSTHFIDANQGWAVGESGLILTTTNGGTTWTQEGSGVTAQTLRRVFSINPVFAAGFAGTILRRDQPSKSDLVAFTATGLKDGHVLLQWQSDYEVDNLGFNLYREHNGKRVRLTTQPVAGSALMTGAALTAGRDYAWWDKGVESRASLESLESQNLRYWLEDLDLNGASTWHGPFSVKQLGGKSIAQSQAALLSSIGKRDDDATPVVEPAASIVRVNRSPLTDRIDLPSSRAVKIAVRQSGWYRITQAELINAGLDPNTNPRMLRLFVDGREVPIAVAGEDDGRFDANDSIKFYGLGLNTPSTNERVYWLTGGSRPGLRINKTPLARGYPSGESFAYTVERRDRTIYFSALKNGDDENFFGAVITDSAVEQRLTLNNLAESATENALIEVSLQGVTRLAHQVRVSINGSPVSQVYFNGQGKGQEKIEVSHALLREGGNVITLQSINGPSDVSLVDAIRITYQRGYRAENDSLTFSAKSGQSATINGFSSKDIRVFDITDERDVQELSASIDQAKDGYAATFTAAGADTSGASAGEHRLLAVTDGKAVSAANIKSNTPSRLRRARNAADLIIISAASLRDSLNPLVDLRRKQGLITELVDVEDIYDEFSFGNKSPQSIKDFLSYAAKSWKTRPRFVLFAGDASYDARNYLGLGENDLVPTKLIDTRFLETASDDWFSDFNDDGIADLSTGRLPIRTPQEASVVVGKLIAYEQSTPSNEVALVADSNDGFNFEQASKSLRSLIPPAIRASEIFRSKTDDATARSQLLEAINRGQKIVNYTGHGSMNVWRGNLLTASDGKVFTNTDRLSFFVMMTCLNGYFHDAINESLGESLLKANSGGAIAVWASSGLTEPAQQAAMSRQLFQLLLNGAGGEDQLLTLGEAVLKAKSAVADPDVRRTWILFGDPTIKLR